MNPAYGSCRGRIKNIGQACSSLCQSALGRGFDSRRLHQFLNFLKYRRNEQNMPEITLDMPGEILDKLDAISKDRNRAIQEAVQDYIARRFFLQKQMIEQSRRIHSAVKAQIAEKFPYLNCQHTEEEIIAEFDRICEKIQQKMKFETPEEVERFMRRDDYGLARY